MSDANKVESPEDRLREEAMKVAHWKARAEKAEAAFMVMMNRADELLTRAEKAEAEVASKVAVIAAVDRVLEKHGRYHASRGIAVEQVIAERDAAQAELVILRTLRDAIEEHCTSQADEIERLRAELKRLREGLEAVVAVSGYHDGVVYIGGIEALLKEGGG